MSDFYSIVCLLLPLMVVLLSFVSRKIILSLGFGIVLGLGLLGYQDLASFLPTAKQLIGGVLLKTDHLKILFFILIISSVVVLMVYNHNISIIAKYLTRYVYNRKLAQLMTWFAGIVIFFDDYANTFIVGNTLKPITDRYRISREKLAFIVDSTAAPIAAIALVSAWLGNQVKEIEPASLHLKSTGYSYFLHSLEYSYYPIFAIAFVLITILTGREFGPMLQAKPLISTAFIHQTKEKVNLKNLFLAVFPILILLVSSIGAMLVSGYYTLQGSSTITLQNLFAAASSIDSLLIGSILSLMSIHFLMQKKRFDKPYFTILKNGATKILKPISILALAWCFGFIITKLNISAIILSFLPPDTSPYLFPGFIFVFSGLISFATGSSFSTMSIVYPIALPIVFEICSKAGISPDMSYQILYHSIACVLAGAVFGDHCSPISDTTILSSIATECNHLQHFKTQFPYAIVVGSLSLFMSLTLANMGLPCVVVYGFGILVLYLIVRVFGRTYI